MHLLQRLLRWCRDRTSAAIAASIAAVPRLESSYVTIGRWIGRRSPLLGTIYWFSQEHLLRRLRQSNRRFRPLRIGGVEMAVDVTDPTGRMDYFWGEPYEPKLARAVAECLSAGDVFVDVGANTGFFSVLAGKCVGAGGRVIAFEPHPDARDVMRRALEVNGLTRIVDVIGAAVGTQPGTVPLFLSTESVLSTVDPSRAPTRADHAFPHSIDVPMVTLDGWLEQRPDLRARVRAIKIDVEGTEADVLRGLAHTLLTSPPRDIFCETTPGDAGDELLRNRGYRAIPLDLYQPPFGNYRYTRGSATSG